MTNPRTQFLDSIIGSRIRKKRRELNIKLHQLGKILNVSHQQVLKYEQGIDRISAVNLWKVSEYFLTPIAWFFDEEK